MQAQSSKNRCIVFVFVLFFYARTCVYSKIEEYDHPKYDPVISENLKVMIPDIFQQELDRNDRYREGNNHSKQQQEELSCGKIESKLKQFQSACPKHDWDRKEECELRRNRS